MLVNKVDYDNLLNDAADIAKQLMQYKDLEKQIGCPLKVLFKALTNGIYCEDVNNNIYYISVDLHINLDGVWLLFFNDAEWVLTKNYKKTWWLREDGSE